MKKVFFLFGLTICLTSFGQNNSNELNKVFRINLLSPGVEIEFPISEKSTISANPGIGIQGTYLHLDDTNSGITYYIAPFLDLSYKKLYNREKRVSKNKDISYNSGNYWGVRLLTNFKEIESKNVSRKDDINFAFGPTWGVQRTYGKLHLLFDIGSVYYFDTKGNNGFFPVMLQLNLGFNARKW
ncbi:MAG TPA: hypothetical protein VLZ72_05795 [Flavobacterium sp.]|nr:hypothetical protein [Flavobacterium sp.]